LTIAGFAGLISVGTVLLMLPASATGPALGFVDAAFTATSAACVTGLVVVDTGKDLSPFGQVVVLFTIQIGGLGIMTLSTVFLLLAGRRPSLASRAIIQDTFTHSADRSLPSLLRDIIRFTLFIEGLGMLLLFFRFHPKWELSQALYLAVFHAISAFCNAGFSPFSDSLMRFQHDWIVNLVICFLIVSGGIGFLVLQELKRNFAFRARTWSRLSLHSKLVISTTVTLLLGGMVSILLMEWGNTLAPLPLPERILAAFFQSVTARTAGFNTLPIAAMANETLFVVILLMFVGASSGSCGGGIKTGTLATLVVMGLSRLRGHDYPQVFRRAISIGSIGRAVSVVLASIVVVALGSLFCMMLELGDVPHTMSRGKFLELLFEVVSAFGTVGLSMGVTAGLSVGGKLLITVIMFVGRLGPLVVAIAVSRRGAPRYRYAEEGIMIG
jgi:trk system potassium uptake protein TrkH